MSLLYLLERGKVPRPCWLSHLAGLIDSLAFSPPSQSMAGFQLLTSGMFGYRRKKERGLLCVGLRRPIYALDLQAPKAPMRLDNAIKLFKIDPSLNENIRLMQSASAPSYWPALLQPFCEHVQISLHRKIKDGVNWAGNGSVLSPLAPTACKMVKASFGSRRNVTSLTLEILQRRKLVTFAGFVQGALTLKKRFLF